MSKKLRILKTTDRVYRVRANAFSEGDEVDTPGGVGVVVEVRTEDFEGPDGSVEASEDNPAYVVGLLDGGATVYRSSDLSDGSLPDSGVENPVEDVKKNASANTVRTNDWTMPESWRNADKPARLILLDAWASMGGQFDCGGACCMGELKSARLCGAMKDEVLQWEGWRKGG